MNAYDFDKTIYDGDSTVDFYLYSLKMHKKILLLAPSLCWAAFRFYALKKGSKTQFKEVMYRFLRKFDAEKETADFWKTHRHKIKLFYLEQQKSDDVIISASPEFLLSPICRELGIEHLIASVVNPKTGKYTGLNCHGAEKAVRFRQEFGNAKIDEFYSDSLSDTPMAEIADKAFLVKGEELLPWKIN